MRFYPNIADDRYAPGVVRRFPWMSLAMAQVACLLVGLLPLANRGWADEAWPQILGTNRDGQATGGKLATEWPKSGPPEQWRYPLGSGYAGAASQDDLVLVFHRVEDEERLECLNASLPAGTTSEQRRVWRTGWPTSYQGGVDPDHGPRCVPVIHDGKVIAFGAAGDLHCVSLADGKQLWNRELGQELQAEEGYFGFGSSPIVWQDRALVNLGGKRGAGLVAVDLATGKTVWQATNEAASYSSPILWRAEPPQVLFVTRMNGMLIDPRTGDVLCEFPFGRRGPTENAAVPQKVDARHAFVTASYGIGAQLVDVEARPPKVVWAGDKELSSQYPTPVLADGFLFGVHGREDGPPAELRCVDARTGEVRWAKSGFGMAHLIRVGPQLLSVQVDGRLKLLAASPKAYQELASAQIPQARITRALPALAHGRLLIRSSDPPSGALICLQVGSSE